MNLIAVQAIDEEKEMETTDCDDSDVARNSLGGVKNRESGYNRMCCFNMA